MGIKNLNTLIEQHSKNGKQRIHLSKYQGLTFAVDTNVIGDVNTEWPWLSPSAK